MRAFTLVEILIVVVILGILAAIVTPQFSRATEDAKLGATLDQLGKVRSALAVYMVRNQNRAPEIEEGDATWGQLMDGSQYLRYAPRNMYVGAPGAQTQIIVRDEPDSEFPTEPTYAWIYSPANQQVWAAGFDAEDRPLDRPD